MVDVPKPPGTAPIPPTPFRSEVPIGDFEKIEQGRNALKIVRERSGFLDKAEDKPITVDLLIERFFKDSQNPGEIKPNEAKMEAFRQGYSLIETDDETKENVAVASKLIDIVRMQDDPGMKLRLASILSHDLQKKYVKTDEADNASMADYEVFMAKRGAFQMIANGPDAAQAAWANSLLKPRGVLEVYNSIYDLGSDLVMTPKVIEEITQEAESNEMSEVVPSELYFNNELVRLHPGWLPSMEKMIRYRELTGTDLPIYLVRKEGAKFLSIPFPSNLTERLTTALKQQREGRMTKEELNKELNLCMEEYIGRLNAEQREAFLRHNVELRFTTERGSSVEKNLAQPVTENVPPTSDVPPTPDVVANPTPELAAA